MTIGLYVPGKSVLHRLSAGIKLLLLAAAGTGLFLWSPWPVSIAAFAVSAMLYPLAGLSLRTALSQIRGVLWILGVLFVAQGILSDWPAAVSVVARLAALILLASLVTLTTRISEMTETLETALRPFERFGVNPPKVSLALSMVVRFVPLIAEAVADIREAQQARGLERNLFALSVPLIIRTLKIAHDVADAIEARSYDPDSR